MRAAPTLRGVAQIDPQLPLRPPAEPPHATLAPPWVALLTAWLGLLMLILSVAIIFLPGSVNPREELEHHRPYSVADRFLPVPIFGITLTLFLGCVVLWQMRTEPRPLPAALVSQRMQAYAGMTLALVGAVVIYTWVGFRGPG
jgi:hypothetical protein